MKSNAIYTIVSAIISAITTVTAGYFLFLLQREDQTQTTLVQRYEAYIEESMIEDITNTFSSGSVNFKDINNSIKLHETIGYGRGNNAEFYIIKNLGDKKINKIEISIEEFNKIYMSYKNTSIVINKGDKIPDIEILPRSAAQIIVIQNYTSKLNNDRFMINGKNVYVQNAFDQEAFSLDEQLYLYVGAHSLQFIFISLIGAATIFTFILSITAYVITRNNPDYVSNNTTNHAIARHLCALNYLKNESPERYRKILKHSDDLYRRWTENNSNTDAIGDH